MQLPPISLQPLPHSWGAEVDPRASAVLALFLKDAEGETSLLFTRRSAELRSHAGQVGFPGGRREMSDESPMATALREANEEIHLDPARVQCLGALPTVKALDGRPVLPIVAWSDIGLEDLLANPEEVAEIFIIPWRELTIESCRQLRFNIFGRWRETPHFEALGFHVWGLTAWMVSSMKLGKISD